MHPPLTIAIRLDANVIGGTRRMSLPGVNLLHMEIVGDRFVHAMFAVSSATQPAETALCDWQQPAIRG